MEKILSFRPITVDEFFGSTEAEKLISEYMAESGNPFLPKQPNLAYYRAAEEAGAFKAVGAFSSDRIVGFGSFVLTVIPHYSTVTASVESIFLAKIFEPAPLDSDSSTLSARRLKMLELTAFTGDAGAVPVLKRFSIEYRDFLE